MCPHDLNRDVLAGAARQTPCLRPAAGRGGAAEDGRRAAPDTGDGDRTSRRSRRQRPAADRRTDGRRAVAYHLRCRSASAVHEFAQAVRRALPIRDADEPRPNGAELVTEKPLERAAPNRVRLLWWGLGGGYVLVLALLLVKGLLITGAPGWSRGSSGRWPPPDRRRGGRRAGRVAGVPGAGRCGPGGSPSRESYRGPTGTRAASSTTTPTSTVTAYGVSARARTEVPSGPRSRTTP